MKPTITNNLASTTSHEAAIWSHRVQGWPQDKWFSGPCFESLPWTKHSYLISDCQTELIFKSCNATIAAATSKFAIFTTITTTRMVMMVVCLEWPTKWVWKSCREVADRLAVSEVTRYVEASLSLPSLCPKTIVQECSKASSQWASIGLH